MNILLLGNGFDLNHKYPTSYYDFLQTVSFLVDNYDESMTTIDKVYGDDRLKSKSDNIQKSYDEYKEFYKTIPLDAELIKALIETAQNNIWFQYLLTSAEKKITWIDFEKEITAIINAFDTFFDNIGLSVSEDEAKEYYLLNCFSFFSDREDTRYFWKITEVKDEYIIESPIGSSLVEIDKQKIISDLYSSLRELAEMLKTYLQVFVDSLSTNIKLQNFKVRNSSYPTIHHVFTFNYTNTYELLYDSTDKIQHIHGNVCDNIVLGINPDIYDDLEDIDTSFIRFKKYFQRVFYATDVNYLETISQLKKRMQTGPKTNRTVYVAGHSLNKTDEDIIREIFDISDKIVILYHSEQSVGNYIENLVSIYGKQGFDELRTKKGIDFRPHKQVELYQ